MNDFVYSKKKHLADHMVQPLRTMRDYENCEKCGAVVTVTDGPFTSFREHPDTECMLRQIYAS